MGSFFGHIDEGVVFLTLGFWWMFNMFRDYRRSQRTGEAYRSRVSYVSTIGTRRVPLEIYLKILFTLGAFLAEIFGPGFPITFVDEDNRFYKLKHLQHMTIYGLFFIHGIIDLMSHHKVSPIMNEMKYITLMIGFFWYASQFYYHSADSTHKPPLENMIHRLPLTTMLAIVFMFVWEMRQRDLITPQLIRCLGVLILGTWFSHVSFILYQPFPFPGLLPNPAYNWTDMQNVHFVTSLYGFHIIFNIIVMLLVYALVSTNEQLLRLLRRIIGRNKGSDQTYEYQKLNGVGMDRNENIKLLDEVEEYQDSSTDQSIC